MAKPRILILDDMYERHEFLVPRWPDAAVVSVYTAEQALAGVLEM